MNDEEIKYMIMVPMRRAFTDPDEMVHQIQKTMDNGYSVRFPVGDYVVDNIYQVIGKISAQIVAKPHVYVGPQNVSYIVNSCLERFTDVLDKIVTNEQIIKEGIKIDVSFNHEDDLNQKIIDAINSYWKDHNIPDTIKLHMKTEESEEKAD